MNQQLSVVVMSWNRNWNDRLYHFLYTLAGNQTVKPYEILIIDSSTDQATIDSVIENVDRFREGYLSPVHLRTHFINPTEVPYKALSLNYGIKNTNEGSKYILTTDIDMVFPPYWVENSLNKMNEGTFLLSEPSKMSEQFNKELDSIDWNTVEWDKLYNRSIPWGKAKGPGNGQFMPREWIFKVHGYNEIFNRGQDGLDMDLWRRAAKDGLDAKWQYRNDNKFLHLYHDISGWKGKNHRLMNVQYDKRNPDVIVNTDGEWGEV